MEIPATAAHFIAVIVIALPGLTYATVRNRARGLAASSISTGSKLGEGLAAGVVFDVVYLWMFGEDLIEIFTLTNDALPSVSGAARTALFLGVVVPAVVAWIVHRGHRWTRPSKWSPVAWFAF